MMICRRSRPTRCWPSTSSCPPRPNRPRPLPKLQSSRRTGSSLNFGYLSLLLLLLFLLEPSIFALLSSTPQKLGLRLTKPTAVHRGDGPHHSRRGAGAGGRWWAGRLPLDPDRLHRPQGAPLHRVRPGAGGMNGMCGIHGTRSNGHMCDVRCRVRWACAVGENRNCSVRRARERRWS